MTPPLSKTQSAVVHRLFGNAGHIVLRFTGSEIYRDPAKCALEVLRNVSDRHHRGSPTFGEDQG